MIKLVSKDIRTKWPCVDDLDQRKVKKEFQKKASHGCEIKFYLFFRKLGKIYDLE